MFIKTQKDFISQIDLEKKVVERLKKDIRFKDIQHFQKIPLEFKDPETGNISKIEFEMDACNPECTVLCELYTGVGEINSEQKRRILTDVLKLIHFENLLNEKFGKIHRKKYLILIDPLVKESLIGKHKTAWAAIGLATFDIQIEVVEV